MISYYQLTKIEKKWGKKVGEAQKLGQSCQKWEKLRKFGKKNWYYMHFDPKNTQKIIKWV